MSPVDPFFKKTLDLRVGRRHLKLDSSQELFSSHEIDKGSRLLIRSLTKGNPSVSMRILDVGCGYGPIGLALTEHHAGSRLVMLDRDALAVRYAGANATRNGFAADVQASLMYDDLVGEPFDLLVSNVPGKGTERFYRHWLLGAGAHLAPGGMAAIVIVKPLASVVASILSGSEVEYRHDYGSHSVFHYRPAPDSESARDAFASGAFDRSTLTMRIGSLSYQLQTVEGLAEFDSLTHSTRLVADMVMGGQDARRVVCLNPGQGHLPVIAWCRGGPDHIELIDRDLLALRTSRGNLLRNGCPPDRVGFVHTDDGGDTVSADLVIDLFRVKEPPDATGSRLRRWADGALKGSRLLVGGTSTSVTRAIEGLAKERGTITLVERRRHEGFSAALFSHR